MITQGLERGLGAGGVVDVASTSELIGEARGQLLHLPQPMLTLSHRVEDEGQPQRRRDDQEGRPRGGGAQPVSYRGRTPDSRNQPVNSLDGKPLACMPFKRPRVSFIFVTDESSKLSLPSDRDRFGSGQVDRGRPVGACSLSAVFTPSEFKQTSCLSLPLFQIEIGQAFTNQVTSALAADIPKTGQLSP